MRAWLTAPGERWDLAERPVPEAGAFQVLVRVRAAAVNRADLDEADGSYRPRGTGTDRHVAGSDVTGEVVDVGSDVTGVRIGDRVLAMVEGALAEYVALDHRLVIPVPARLTAEQAAALPSALMTEYDALIRQGGMPPGGSVLITAGTSGVGLIGAEIARWAGAGAVAVTTTRAQAPPELAGRGLRVITGGIGGLRGAVADGLRADLIVDHTGGDWLDELIAATRIGGTIMQVGRLAGRRAALDLDRLALRRVRIVGTTFRTRDDEQRAAIAAAIRRDLSAAVDSGEITPVVARTVPFAEADRAVELLRGGGLVGKVVVLFG
ncbi:NAD(P)H-quinone oxidoreductase [Saccharopolyspora gloriosae]|uniref:NADPH:quinone reductase-like Zn-dependent oxidoreductase n=1 Tax=Saccharopolyspora gloriosae TaxID=455344 RepID=A0A840NI14_9PSEU|nr:zinc-binding dehydrogenase [Saccharopolyspora gloriosae]MBB5071520.1 NADPH:quinone reductase-like Zn-dependent oxidoreductase [Saccharopolyspora gloriosae]